MYNYHFSYPDTCASTFPKKLFIYWELSCLKQRETTKNIKTYRIFFTKNKKLYKFISSAVPQIHPVSPDELYTKHMKRSSTSSIQVIAPLETESTIHWTVYRKTYLSFYNSRYKICSFIRNIFEGFMQFAFFFWPPTFLHRQVYSCTVELWCLYHWYLKYHWCVKVSQNHCSIIHIHVFTTSITLGYLKDLC